MKVRYLRPSREIEIQVTVSAATADDLARLTTQTLTAGADGTGVDQPCFVCPRQEAQSMAGRPHGGELRIRSTMTVVGRTGLVRLSWETVPGAPGIR
ncbi:hypothetical protein [Streptomyces gossypii]|uniref:hypothetical protein n=1 Tax=Streptomyces gossypii TaxID=2883101 RepID=UPI0021A81017|nr:hypothetical protein [Streptomyces gossypii]